MRMMEFVVLLMVMGTLPAAEGAGAAGGRLAADAPVDEILEALDERGRDLRDFRADVRLTETDPNFGLSTARLGRVWYERRDEHNARIRVTFDKREERGRMVDEQIDYLLDDGWLVDRNYRQRVEVRRQVLRPGERVDLLKLGEGPFPLPIGQDKQEVHRLFVVEKLDGGDNPPANSVHIRLTPREGTQFSRDYHAIEVWVDLDTAMPARIETEDSRQAGIRTTDLSNIRVNEGVEAEDFVLPAVGADWQRRDEGFEG
jgi:outer membrane lipoprotein-sorting protein